MSLILPESLRKQRRAKRTAELREKEAALWSGFSVDPPTMDPNWQKMLDALAPRTGELSWLKLAWYPGYPWQPVHRWVIYQMVEIHRVPPLVVPFLEGPDPRTLGYYDTVKEQFITRSPISRYQWDLYQETGCFAQTFWIIQGERGGHKAKLNHVESALSRMHGGPAQPPDPGMLPYAVLDQRVMNKLEPLERTNKYAAMIDFAERRPGDLDREDLEQIGKMRTELWDWLGSQVMEVLEPKEGLLKKAMDGADLPRHVGRFEEVEERGKQEFIEDDSL